MTITDRVRSLAARIARCERSGASESDVTSLRSQVAELEREVASLESANVFLRSENANLRDQIRDLRTRAGALIVHSATWRNAD
jgi:cell division protein FtsB